MPPIIFPVVILRRDVQSAARGPAAAPTGTAAGTSRLYVFIRPAVAVCVYVVVRFPVPVCINVDVGFAVSIRINIDIRFPIAVRINVDIGFAGAVCWLLYTSRYAANPLARKQKGGFFIHPNNSKSIEFCQQKRSGKHE